MVLNFEFPLTAESGQRSVRTPQKIQQDFAVIENEALQGDLLEVIDRNFLGITGRLGLSCSIAHENHRGRVEAGKAPA